MGAKLNCCIKEQITAENYGPSDKKEDEMSQTSLQIQSEIEPRILIYHKNLLFAYYPLTNFCNRKEIPLLKPLKYFSLIDYRARIYVCGGIEELGNLQKESFTESEKQSDDDEFEEENSEVNEGETVTGKPSKCLFILDEDQYECKRKRDMREGKFDHGFLGLDYDLFTIGGDISTKSNSGKPTAVCERFDIRKNRWSKVSMLNEKKSRVCTCTLGRRYLYCFGGVLKDRTRSKIIEYNSIESKKWSVVNIRQDSETAKLTKEIAIALVMENTSQSIIIFAREGSMIKLFFFDEPRKEIYDLKAEVIKETVFLESWNMIKYEQMVYGFTDTPRIIEYSLAASKYTTKEVPEVTDVFRRFSQGGSEDEDEDDEEEDEDEGDSEDEDER